MQQKNIVITGAKNNNLKNVSLTIPRNKLIVFTGVSGSGKSTLAFDTIYAEGQRCYSDNTPRLSVNSPKVFCNTPKVLQNILAHFIKTHHCF